MSSLCKVISISKNIGILCGRFNTLKIANFEKNGIFNIFNPSSLSLNTTTSYFHTSHKRLDIMEFFDDKKNWGENEVKVGRSWTKDELRIKSNTDIHKLWFVLLKERNMLMTMEHECNEKLELFPCPERIDKVKISMENIETVVRERNKAYHMLEIGTDGERPGSVKTNQLGLNFFYREREHLIPKVLNRKWRETHIFQAKGNAVKKFLLFYRERLWNEKRKKNNRDRNHATRLLSRFPNIDKNMLADKYPSVDLDKLIRNDKCRGHHEPK